MKTIPQDANKKPLSFVTQNGKQTTQTRHNTTSLFRLQTNNPRKKTQEQNHNT